MLEDRACAYILCDEIFPVTNERKIFCCDQCRARQHAWDNSKEQNMFREAHNKIIANYRILKSQRVGRIFQRTELRLLGYKIQYCSRFTTDRVGGVAVTYWCYNFGLKKVVGGLELVKV
jgi:hypothetical protein